MADNVPTSMKIITELKDRSVAIDVQDTTVAISIDCGDAYLAQVFFEDITERLQSGRAIALSFGKPSA